tara:strand:+ start:1209 stop:2732 length:1524 start_codon:yes stop_codon:yes gene_type:complete
MNKKSFSKFFEYENILQFLVLSIPALLITGPFLPDLFLSLSSISFLIYLIIKKRLNFLESKIFYFFLVFLFLCISSSILSDYRLGSLPTSLGYFRFGIFIFVIAFLSQKKSNFIKNLSFVLITIFIILFFDAILQKLTGSNILGVQKPFGRVTSLFGEDIKLGGYVMRLVPLLIASLIYLKSNKFLVFSIILLSLFLTLISGERTSFIMTLVFTISFITIYQIELKKKFLLILIPFTIFLISLFNEEIRYRVLTTTLNQINFTDSQPYYKMERTKNDNLVVIHSDSTLLPRVYHMYIETGIKIFNDNILIGSGPRTYRFKSKEDKYLTISDHEGWINYVENHNKELINKLRKIHIEQINKISNHKKFKLLKENRELINQNEYKNWLLSHGLSSLDFQERIKNKDWLKGHGFQDKDQEGFTNISGVNNHPHNTYIQLLSETGVLGFSLIISIWIFSMFKIFTNIDLYSKCILIGILINLFPIMPTGNFFNNWLSILYFYPLGFLIKKT